jgi:Predicted membrane protein (DUF2207)
MSPTRRWLPAALASAAPTVVLALSGVLPASGAAAEDRIASYAADVTLGGDGVLHVQETVDVTAGGDTVTRTLQTRFREDEDEDRRYEVGNLSVTVDGQPAEDLRDEEIDSGREISVRTGTGEAKIVYKYDVEGTVAESSEGTEVSWPVLQGLPASVQRATVTANVPFATWVACFAGRPGSGMPCTSSQLGESAAVQIEQLGVPAGGRLTFRIGLSNTATVQSNAEFTTRWSLGRAFAVDSSTVGLSSVLLGLGVLGAAGLWYLRGRDTGRGAAAGATVRPVLDGESGPQFAAPDGIRPGQLGTVADETADVVDITATLLDLAVRNYLTIVELPRNGEFGKLDWQLQRRNEGGPELLPYEKALLDAIFADGETVTVSGLGPALRPRLESVREHLYADVVTQGWFAQRPDAVRNRWTTAGVVLVLAGAVLTVILAIATKFGLVGLAVILAGVALTVAGQAAPARTARGSAVLGQVAGLRAYLRDQSSADLPAEHRLEFAARCLPYATVLGLTEKWALEIAGTDEDEDPDAGIGWYSGPENWHLSNIGESLSNFVTAVSGSLSSTRRLFPE